MGQSLGSANQTQSKDEFLFQFVLAGNVERIRALCNNGANLECIDREGNTPLIVACKDSALLNVAVALIELGANVNAYGPGRRGGTPLHHAASRGLEETVRLLLFSGGNALLRNDDGQTALDLARINRNAVVVRAIEESICLFSGWLRQFYGPGFLKVFAPQLLSSKVWAVVLPHSSRNSTGNFRLQLAIYSNLQDSQACTLIPLWRAKIEEPKFEQPDPEMTVFDQSTNTRYHFASSKPGDKYQLRLLYDACRGITQVVPTPTRQQMQHENPEEAIELAMALSASIQTAMEHGPGPVDTNGWGDSTCLESRNGWGDPVEPPQSEASSSSRVVEEAAAKENYNGWDDFPNTNHVSSQPHSQIHQNDPTSASLPSAAPSAPPIPDFAAIDQGPIHYPSVNLGPVDISSPATEYGASSSTSSEASVCIICWDAPVQGACVPCGHMAGCMTCLGSIKAKKGDCPVCRAKITQVIRLYAV